MPTYNTIMAVAGGTALLLLVAFLRQLLRAPADVSSDGYALAFGVTGFICTTTGLHMSLTWPLAAGGFPFDNIIFGETTLALGVAVSALALWLWRRFPALLLTGDPVREVAKATGPLSIFGFGMGLGALGIAVAGIVFQLFAAPPQEPISGLFADYPMVEATFISALFALVGIGCLVLPFLIRAVRRNNAGAVRSLGGVLQVAWVLAGAAFFLFGALNYFTHIGLIVHTMG